MTKLEQQNMAKRQLWFGFRIQLLLVLGAFWISGFIGESAVYGQGNPEAREVRVGVTPFEPMVIEGEDGNFTGFDIELLREIARDNGWRFQLEKRPFGDLLNAVADRKLDMGLAGITINQEREARVDFSYGYFVSGLRILVAANSPLASGSTLKAIFNWTVLKALGYLALFTFICGNLIWFLEKGHDAFNDDYFPGIFEGFWWCFVTMTTVGYGDFAPKRWLGRVVAVPVMFSGIVFFAWFIAQMQVVLDLEHDAIRQPKDLAGMMVGTKSGTTSEAKLRELGAKVKTFPEIHRAYLALASGQLDAVVFDAPNIMDFAKKDEAGNYKIAGPLFEKQNYGIAFPEDSPLVESVNRSLLRMQEDGTIDRIYKKYFGTPES